MYRYIENLIIHVILYTFFDESLDLIGYRVAFNCKQGLHSTSKREIKIPRCIYSSLRLKYKTEQSIIYIIIYYNNIYNIHAYVMYHIIIYCAVMSDFRVVFQEVITEKTYSLFYHGKNIFLVIFLISSRRRIYWISVDCIELYRSAGCDDGDAQCE